MSEEIPTVSETERLRAQASRLREDRLDNARRVQGDFAVEDEQAGIESAARIEDKGTVELIGDSAASGFQDTAAAAIGREVAKIGTRWDDPNWNPRQNPEQQALIENDLQELNLDVEGPEAEALIGARSDLERQVIKNQIIENRERLRTVADAKSLGMVAYLAANVFDIDTLTGVGLFTKLRKAKALKRLENLQEVGDITADEAKALSTASSRLENLQSGAEAGATSAIVVEGTRAILDPTADEKDVLAASIMATGLGTAIGSALPARRIENIAEDIATTRILREAKKRDPERVNRRTFNSAMRFVEDAEGGFANVAGDRGGRTMFGITERFYPKQHAEVMRLMETKGHDAARRYARDFYKGEFYNKVVTPDMTPQQATIMFDTAVNSGVGTAKRLFEQAGGDVNRFLDLRQDFVEDIVRKDPSQEKFLQGWTNRINNLRNEVAGTPLSRVQEGLDPERSVGAGSIPQNEIRSSASSESLRAQAWDFFDENPDVDAAFRGLDEFVNPDASFGARMSQRFAEKTYQGLKNTPFISDYDRLVKDAGVTGRYLAYHTLDNPLGINVNNRAAVAVADDINYMASIEYAPNRAAHYKEWAGSKGYSRTSKDYWIRGEAEFNSELRMYREQLNAGLEPDPNTHPSIVRASEDLDRSYAMALENNKRYGVEGFEDVEFKPGHVPRRWLGDRFAQIENNPGVGSQRVVEALQTGIMRLTPDMDEQVALIYAQAIRRSAKNNQLQNPVGSLMTVNEQGQDALELAILDLGLVNTADEATEMARSILFKDSERGTVKSSRRRINIDMTTPIPGTDNTLIDLVDNDLYGLTDRTIRAQSNHAAMASVGIQRRDQALWLRAAMDEAEESGRDVAKAQKAVNDMFAMFGEGQIGSMDPNAARINKLGRMSFLAQLGVTQIAETGLAIGVGGLRGWSHYAKKSIPDLVKGNDVELMNDLYGLQEWVGDHRTFVSTNHLDEFQLQDAPKLLGNFDMGTLDRGMDKGMRGMGYISGFYKTNEMLDALGALTLNNYMVKAIRDGRHNERLATMGVDDEFRNIIKARIDSGDIQFGPEGHVSRMGAANWDPSELELLRRVTRRNMQAMLQRARKGESQSWQYDTLGSLFSSLKSYVFTAAQKQLLRNARIADPEAFQMLLASTGTAGVAFAAKQIINGDAERLNDTEFLAKGALNWSPMVSPALMVIDPLSFLLGADQIPGSPIPFNEWRYGHQGLISMPAGITALNQLSELGRLPLDVIDDGELSRDSINAIKAIPVVGRSYPMIPIIETLDKD